ncbi:hypothetical protein BC832DRAFT_559411 [Gaertneriomyces semiglobifer]|nr:hypothetical protein BC832DRAFT_559411 [Gaertneriomyces semiglobifer]
MREVTELQNLATRFLHSKYARLFYGGMLALSAVCLWMSFRQACPTRVHHTLELILTILLLLSLGLTYFSSPKHFLNMWTYLDIFTLLLCSLTLLPSLFSNSALCSGLSRSEWAFEEVLLIIRNAAGLVRMIGVARRGTKKAVKDITFDVLPVYSDTGLLSDERLWEDRF